ncbi:phosphotransferase family protein [Streptomyces sp. NPDC092952]|uniref:phosphotransferase family protein n=1 Tax=Streptomyces sp. NPDC092952 TaxID=3366018 RepID=UPI00381473C9
MTAAERWSTHVIEMRGDLVTKRYAKGDAHALLDREWRALTLLDAHAPGLAPVPVAVDRDADPPMVVMSRIPGVPLRGSPVDGARTAAMAKTLDALYGAVPGERLARVPVRPGHWAGLAVRLRDWHGRGPGPAAGDAVRAALDEGMAWLDRPGRAAGPGTSGPPVFGPGDGNLANYLWDGTTSRVGVVDFEDSGRSDRPFELAEITEHVSGWIDGGFDAASFLDCFELTADEWSRLRECRRLLALTWTFILSFDDPERPRNPPGTAARQAERLRALLG